MNIFEKYLFLKDLENILRERTTSYKLPESLILKNLTERFWRFGDKSYKRLRNRVLYKEYCNVCSDVISKGESVETCKNVHGLAAILKKRNKELFDYFVDFKYLVKDDDVIPSFYISRKSPDWFFVTFKWLIVEVLFMAVFVAIFVGLMTNFLWDWWLRDFLVSFNLLD